jgi:hypothetical protein
MSDPIDDIISRKKGHYFRPPTVPQSFRDYAAATRPYGKYAAGTAAAAATLGAGGYAWNKYKRAQDNFANAQADLADVEQEIAIASARASRASGSGRASGSRRRSSARRSLSAPPRISGSRSRRRRGGSRRKPKRRGGR